ncbi:MAG: SDR family oxidoreductase [Gammaproteobacteria bacterium AqS3]|nr:SDR family oxidoreductase [Gammaproteobacteria bacterium AqS3]
MERLTGKVALITGAARGLGAAMARRFRDEGATVVVNDLNQEAAEAVAQSVQGLGLAADVSDSKGVDAMFEQVVERYGRLDVLVNNAGISGMEDVPADEIKERMDRNIQRAMELATTGETEIYSEPTLETTDDEWHRMLGIHLGGTFFCTRAAFRIMNPQGSGSVVNLSSIMGTSGGMAPAYCAAKAGILGLTRAHANEGAQRSIRVNAIAPGWIDTDMTAPLGPMRDMIKMQTPLRTFGEPDDIAWAAVYLASDEAKFITGQVISPNGGWYMSQ